MDNIGNYFILVCLLGLGLALILRGLYQFIIRAVKQALREYEQEKETQNGPKSY